MPLLPDFILKSLKVGRVMYDWEYLIRHSPRGKYLFSIRSTLGPTQPPIQRVWGGSFRRGKVGRPWGWPFTAIEGRGKKRNAWSYPSSLDDVFIKKCLMMHKANTFTLPNYAIILGLIIPHLQKHVTYTGSRINSRTTMCPVDLHIY